LRWINLLDTPTLGDIYVHGDEVKFRTIKKGSRTPTDLRQVAKIRSRLSMVFQGFNFGSHMTVLEDIIEAPISVLGIPRALAIEKANALLNKVGIYER
jgi:arginine/ornithine transport system ATP-binding protein